MTASRTLRNTGTYSAFTDLMPRTKAGYQMIFDYLQPISDTRLARFDRPLVLRIRDKAEARGWVFANHLKALLSVVFACGSERGLIKDNPASGIKNIKRKKHLPDANRPSTDEERGVVLAAAPDHIRPAITFQKILAELDDAARIIHGPGRFHNS